MAIILRPSVETYKYIDRQNGCLIIKKNLPINLDVIVSLWKEKWRFGLNWRIKTSNLYSIHFWIGDSYGEWVYNKGIDRDWDYCNIISDYTKKLEKF